VRHRVFQIMLILATHLVFAPQPLAAQESSPPEFTIPGFDADAEPQAASSKPTATSTRQELPPEAIEFIRGIALLLIPQKFEDDDGWGDETKIQSGLNMRIKNGQLHTSRRWKHVNHGNWLQASGILEEPEKTFRLSAARLPDPEEGTQRYDVDVSARIRVTGRQQQWSLGVMLWSISAEAVATAGLHLVMDVKTQVVHSDKGTRLRFLPNVTQTDIRLTSFSLRRISHLKGKPVQEVGNWIEKLIRRRVGRENEKLAARINKVLKEKPERLEIPFDIANWFSGVPSKSEAKLPDFYSPLDQFRSPSYDVPSMSKSVEEIKKTTVSACSSNSETVPAVESTESVDGTELSATELLSIRDDKLAAIRRAVEKGDYDSDAIFDKALTQMLRRLEESEDGQ